MPKKTLSEKIKEIAETGRLLKEPEWTNEIIDKKYITIVDQDGEIRKKICRKHNVVMRRKHNDMIPNMVSAQRRWELENQWYWYCEKCSDDAHNKFMRNYNHKEVNSKDLGDDE